MAKLKASLKGPVLNSKLAHVSGQALDNLQAGLDVAGMIPGAGAAFDLMNAGVSLARGDIAGAVFSAGAAIPGVGDAMAAAKLTKRAVKLAKKPNNPFDPTKNIIDADDVVKNKSKEVMDVVRDVYKNTKEGAKELFDSAVRGHKVIQPNGGIVPNAQLNKSIKLYNNLSRGLGDKIKNNLQLQHDVQSINGKNRLWRNIVR